MNLPEFSGWHLRGHIRIFRVRSSPRAPALFTRAGAGATLPRARPTHACAGLIESRNHAKGPLAGSRAAPNLPVALRG